MPPFCAAVAYYIISPEKQMSACSYLFFLETHYIIAECMFDCKNNFMKKDSRKNRESQNSENQIY